jgi:predicted RNase H-like HicB family nuclease
MLKLKPLDVLTITKDEIEYQFEVAEEGAYVVSVPDLPGCVSEGDSFEQAWDMIQDAMQGWLRAASDHGDPVPFRFTGRLWAG